MAKGTITTAALRPPWAGLRQPNLHHLPGLAPATESIGSTDAAIEMQFAAGWARRKHRQVTGEHHGNGPRCSPRAQDIKLPPVFIAHQLFKVGEFRRPVEPAVQV